MDYKTVEAPPTITLPTGPKTTGPPPVATRRNTYDQAQPDDPNLAGQFPNSLLSGTMQYNGPPPVPAKPVPPPKPQAPVRPQPAPRRSLQGRGQQQGTTSSTAPASSSSSSTAFSPSSAYLPSPQDSDSNRDFAQGTRRESSSSSQQVSTIPSYSSLGQENFALTPICSTSNKQHYHPTLLIKAALDLPTFMARSHHRILRVMALMGCRLILILTPLKADIQTEVKSQSEVRRHRVTLSGSYRLMSLHLLYDQSYLLPPVM
ncbi:hypothetical protein EGW08_008930 [Elysia chlorotica]|uniref:Uncharacterized protein n=1 Tax=Elysia chlorotica TaxID=188477 RepID=A0A3S1B9Z9_ELYCH|nr:hypothetical protein EGW08_008930 [Elysia chlorotica]